MKKCFIMSIIMLLAMSAPANSEGVISSYAPTEKKDEVFFQSSLTKFVSDEDDVVEAQGLRYSEADPDNMPFFKQVRLKITNKLLEDRAQRPKKIKSKKQVSDIDTNSFDKNGEDDLLTTLHNQTNGSIPEDAISLEGGVNEQVTEKQMTLDAEYIDYEDSTGDVIATGRPVLFFPPQNVKVIADKMTYNEDSNILKGIGNVVVIKDSIPTTGSYIEIDMNEETLVMDNIEAQTYAMKMGAEKAVQQDGLLILTNGKLTSDKSQVHRLASRMVGPRFREMMVEEDAESLFFGNPKGNHLKLKIGALYVEARKNHDVVKAKKITFYHKDKKLFTWPSLTAYTDKDRQYFEANYPEFGSKRKVGLFAGPGFVFGGPGGSIIKAVPFVNYNHKFGFGGAVKYKNTYNNTEIGYGSASDIFFLKGLQRLDDNLFLKYGANTYTDEWFLGSRMPKYMAEVFYDKKFLNKNFLADNMDMTFRHRFGFGLMEDNDRNFNKENIASSGMSTTRLRYMAEIAQTLYKYRNEKERIAANFGISMQGSAAVYGTGDTQFIGRIGPKFRFQYKNWMQDLGYYISGYSDETPLPRYDKYRYGHSSVYLSEILRINKYLSVGWSGNINLSHDAPNGKMFQENRFVVAFGPDDFKISLGYDFVRQTTYFGFDVLFDTKGTQVEYEKMEIKNPERLGQKPKGENDRKLAFTPSKNSNNEVKVSSKRAKNEPQKPQVLQYAQVIELEDPDKEKIQ